jgi:YidC/Oxa1 family membrane protein insertase
MDRNTITGSGTDFCNFYRIQPFNSNRLTKAYTNTIEKGDSLYNAGNDELASIEYLKAIKYKPNQPEAIEKLNNANRKIEPAASTGSDTVIITESAPAPAEIQQPVRSSDPLSYGAFSKSAEGENSFITLENNLVKLTLSTLGGRPYSAELLDFKTWDGKPLILFDGDSTVFGLKFFTSDNKAVKTNDLYFVPESGQTNYIVSAGKTSLKLRSYAGEDQYIEYIYSLEPESYMIGLECCFIISMKLSPQIRPN